ncbi:MAG: hypothetical protein H7Z37_16610 [Pyrinomonadaceae bacterium]|nr:hypothetical protein [Pyrinomonadaceae bacterium]
MANNKKGMVNLQQLPNEADVVEIDDRAPNVEEQISIPVPADEELPIPINDPLFQKDKKPINEIPNEPMRIMSAMSAYQRRIF